MQCHSGPFHRHQCRRLWLPALAVLLLLTITLPAAAVDLLEERLRHRLEVASEHGVGLVDGALAAPGPRLTRFYEERVFAPAWVDADGAVPLGRALVAAIENAEDDGMEPADYPLPTLRRMLAVAEAGSAGTELLIDLEFLLTGTYLVFASHALAGRVDPETVDPAWHIERRRDDAVVTSLESALQSGRVAETLRELFPDNGRYRQLRKALARYRAIDADSGFTRIDAGPALRPGDRSERVMALRERLRQSRDLPAEAAMVDDAGYYDTQLEDAVRAFQRRHGLEVDSIVGPRTLEAMNVSAEDRVRQILVNLERWRWLPGDLGARHLLVNIAAFELELVMDDRVVDTQRVIVGRDYRQTPVFAGRMTYLVFNPSWEVPTSIAVRDVLPQVRRDPEYLERMGFQVLRGWGAAQQEIDPARIDWQSVSARGFPYRFRQRPGPLNALGQVKFMFPNQYAVYLHDTPARELFDRAERAFSSGCIRVESPLRLARLVLDDDRWDDAAIGRVLIDGRERTVSLARPVPVYLQYMTAWADENGTVHLRRDLYDRDTRVADALREGPPDLTALY